jgi:hypothetical protein
MYTLFHRCYHYKNEIFKPMAIRFKEYIENVGMEVLNNKEL